MVERVVNVKVERMFSAFSSCSYHAPELTVLSELHEGPTVERPTKYSPITGMAVLGAEAFRLLGTVRTRYVSVYEQL